MATLARNVYIVAYNAVKQRPQGVAYPHFGWVTSGCDVQTIKGAMCLENAIPRHQLASEVLTATRKTGSTHDKTFYRYTFRYRLAAVS